MTPVSSATAAPATSSSGASSSSGSGGLGLQVNGTQQEFLQLLVAEMQNQDPLNPVSGQQMMSQLVQLETLQALLAIQQELQSPTTTASASSGATPSVVGTGPHQKD